MKKTYDLPSEIIADILSRMPVDSVLQCKRVCKTWRSLVDHDPTFLALHTHRFITSSSSSSSSSSGGELVIKSAAAAAFTFFVMVSRCRAYSDEFYFGEYPYNNINNNNNNDAEKKNNTTKYNVSNYTAAPLMKLSNKSIPISYRVHRLLSVHNSKCVSSCNGLILIASVSHSISQKKKEASVSHSEDNNNNNNNDVDMSVFNPVTREYVHLPRPPPPFDKYHRVPFHKYRHDGNGGGGGGGIGIGFGYHPITNEYKVVRITYDDDESDYISSVYTLGSGIWRKIKGETKTKTNLVDGGDGNNNNNHNHIYPLRWSANPAVLLNGVLHWLRSGYGYGVILSFDLVDEELKILPLPPQENPYIIDHLHLGVLEGCLCLSANIEQSRVVDIWVLNKLEEEDQNQEYYSTAAASASSSCSWTRKYSLSTEATGFDEKYEIVADLGGGKILFSRFHDRKRVGLVSYDPKTGFVEDLNDKRCFGISRWNRWLTIDRWSAMIPYMKSFVSLKALGEDVVVDCNQCFWMGFCKFHNGTND